MSERDVVTLVQFIDKYDRKYRGRLVTVPKTRDTCYHEGRITIWETYTYTFTDEVGIRVDYEYRDDEG